MTITNANTFGALLQKHLREIPWTHPQLAEAVEVEPRSVSNWVTGRVRIRARHFRAVVEELKHQLTLSEEQCKELHAAWMGGDESKDAQTNLPTPAQMTELIGRDQEQERVLELLSKSHLVTLTGSPGSGKTRLAQEIGWEVLPQFRDGVWLVNLGALTELEQVVQTVISTARLIDDPTRCWDVALIDQLKNKHLLLILDNCEHLLDACEELAMALLRCRQVFLLATSREPLTIDGEVAYRVPPLKFPERGEPPPFEEKEVAAYLARLQSYGAVQLFVERALAVYPDFRLTKETAEAVRQICVGLDGLPLAIKLAAAQVSVYPPLTIARLLEKNLAVLATTPRKDKRYQTLEGALDWSYTQLEPGQQRLFARLAIFADGWTLDAAEQVSAGDGITPDEVQRNLTLLVKKSLVEPALQGRFGLLQTTRRYALDRLKANREEILMRRRLRDWCNILVDQANRERTGSKENSWLERLEAERNNILTVVTSSGDDTDDVTIRFEIAANLRWFWDIHGHFREGLSVLEGLLREGSLTSPAAHAQVLTAAGDLAYRQGQYALATEYHERALPLFRESVDKGGEAGTLIGLGNVALFTGQIDRAEILYKESLELRREIGDRRGIASSLDNLAEIAYEQGSLDLAHTYYVEALSIAEDLGDRIRLGSIWNGLGHLAFRHENYGEAGLFLQQALNCKWSLGDKWGLPFDLDRIGILAAAVGLTDQSAMLLGGSEALRGLIQSPPARTFERDHKQVLVMLETSLGTKGIAKAIEAGRSMPLGEMIDLARTVTNAAMKTS